MSEREMHRAAVLSQVKSKSWTLVEAAERMEMSYRQAKRLWKRYQSEGAAGLVHGNAAGVPMGPSRRRCARRSCD